jgi:hypothetical protein
MLHRVLPDTLHANMAVIEGRQTEQVTRLSSMEATAAMPTDGNWSEYVAINRFATNRKFFLKT